MHRFKDLEIWKRSRIFCSKIYAETAKFPENEKFGITNQLRRAFVSIPSNIAEGSSRASNKELSRFLEIAIGSAYEIETQLLISNDLKFLEFESLESLLNELEEIIKMISKFRSTLKI
ncbi:four helix bundle protein [Flavobacterium ammonificans]|uniref:Four helix bundle protein n=1 Tax=Flavobacterium ammonificans TaxID=1751056 RepID=A0ABN6KVD9_9FLAO|nr:four helix bundle protein [Flavobacterium ammonificans]BDB53122.1 four helix bundle protein [Flavobacterium ammonificans]